MISFNVEVTWHLLLMIIIQSCMVFRWIYMTITEESGGYLGKGFASAMALMFYGFISVAMWLIYGGFVWW